MKIIRGETFTETLHIEEDNVLVTDCTFTGSPAEEGAIMARNCACLIVSNCAFRDLSSSGVVLRSTGGTIGARIIGNQFAHVDGNGVIAKTGNYFVEISRNQFWQVGDTDKHHPIYALAPDVLIEGNDIGVTNGDGISIRTSGIVRGNKIRRAGKSAIRYYSDGAPGASNTLIVEDNECNGSGPGHAVISLLAGGGEMVGRYVIRRNKILNYAEQPFYAAPEFQGQVIELEL